MKKRDPNKVTINLIAESGPSRPFPSACPAHNALDHFPFPLHPRSLVKPLPKFHSKIPREVRSFSISFSLPLARLSASQSDYRNICS